MATDPFEGVGEFGQEVGAPTFAELIYTVQREGKTFPPATATVENSVARLAFGKPGPFSDVAVQTPPALVPATPLALQKYSLSGSRDFQNFRAQRLAAEFRELVNNAIVIQENPTDDIPDDCETAITQVRTYVEWNGVVRQPINIFNIVARLTYRNQAGPFDKTVVNLLPVSDGRLATVAPVACGGSTVADFWKQQGNAGFAQTAVTSSEINAGIIDTIDEGDFVGLSKRVNWLWAIPGSTTGSDQDSLVTSWPTIPAGLLESIEFLILANAVNPPSVAGNTDPACPGPFAIGPDPATEFDFVVRYVNGRGQSREFRQTLAIADLFHVTGNFTAAAHTWDFQAALKYGIKGSTARWESAKFVLDTVDGAGLDQCTPALSFTTRGSGTLTFPKFGLGLAQGNAFEPCEPSVRITTIQTGSAVNEQQAITLPVVATTDGGTWLLSFTYNDETDSAVLDAEVTAEELQTALEGFSNIGPDNVTVTRPSPGGPFFIEFKRALGGVNLPLLEADGSNLITSGGYAVNRHTVGTADERQFIYAYIDTAPDIKLLFNGEYSSVLTKNSTVAEFQSALDAMSTIGPGNVVVSRDTQSPFTTSNWILDFVGTFAGVNVPQVVVVPVVNLPGWNWSTIWNGEIGVNEVHQIIQDEDAGPYQLRFENPDNPGEFATTDFLTVSSTSPAIAAEIVATVDWFDTADIAVSVYHINGNFFIYIFYQGDYSHQTMPLVTLIQTPVLGGAISVTEIVAGSGKMTRQRVDIVKGKGGQYKLLVTMNGVTRKTPAMQWNRPPELVAVSLNSISFFDGLPVTANEATSSDPDVTFSYVVNFHRSFGSIDTMEAEFDQLDCGGIGLRHVPSPPYEYILEECNDDSPFCSSGPLLCRPGPGDIEIESQLCCEPFSIRDSANVYREIVLQRDLFDPNMVIGHGKALTIKDMAVIKGLQVAAYAAYRRDFATGKLRAIAMDTAVEPTMSILLVERAIDSDATRQRLSQRLRSTPNILPSRSVW